MKAEEGIKQNNEKILKLEKGNKDKDDIISNLRTQLEKTTSQHEE